MTLWIYNSISLENDCLKSFPYVPHTYPWMRGSWTKNYTISTKREKITKQNMPWIRMNHFDWWNVKLERHCKQKELNKICCYRRHDNSAKDLGATLFFLTESNADVTQKDRIELIPWTNYKTRSQNFWVLSNVEIDTLCQTIGFKWRDKVPYDAEM